MSYYKIKNIICKISVVIFIISIISASFLSIKLKPSGKKIFGIGFKSAKIAKGNPENGDYVFVVIQNSTEKENEIKSILSLLRQNELYHCYFKLGNDEDEHSVKECLEHLPYNQDIILISHNLGERLENKNIAGRIIISPTKVEKMDVPTLLISSTVDKQSTPKVITSIYNDLTGSKINETGFGVLAEKNNITLKIVPSTVDKNTLLTAEYINNITNWINKNWDLNLSYYDFGFLNGLILVIMLISGFAFLMTENIEFKIHENNFIPHIINVKVESSFKFGLVRFFSWLGSFILFLVLVLLLGLIPMVTLTVRLTFSAHIFTFGLITWILYKKGIMPGLDGNINYRDTMSFGKLNLQKSLIFMIPGVLTFIYSVLLGFAEIEFGLKEIIGFVISIVLAFIGFYVYLIDRYVLEEMHSEKGSRFFHRVGFFLPMLLVSLICIPFAYPTWLYVGIITTAFVGVIVAAGESMYRNNRDMLFTALIQAIVFSFFVNFIKIGGY